MSREGCLIPGSDSNLIFFCHCVQTTSGTPSPSCRITAWYFFWQDEAHHSHHSSSWAQERLKLCHHRTLSLLLCHHYLITITFSYAGVLPCLELCVSVYFLSHGQCVREILDCLKCLFFQRSSSFSKGHTLITVHENIATIQTWCMSKAVNPPFRPSWDFVHLPMWY
jgi:hypothetical protein